MTVYHHLSHRDPGHAAGSRKCCVDLTPRGGERQPVAPSRSARTVLPSPGSHTGGPVGVHPTPSLSEWVRVGWFAIATIVWRLLDKQREAETPAGHPVQPEASEV